MAMPDQGGDSMGAESGSEPARRREESEPARPRHTVRVIAGQLAREGAGAAVEAVVGAWAPEWVEVVRVLVMAAPAAAGLRRRRGRGGRRRA
ncbi:hypothetical protein ABZZ17_18680 [Streptomyces sp. NPDC006512]|uniref:hypothetical protein n=1 Tax=Streptomyces sp. NPDC006512 TaxID=3154307 RepID=UPI00339F4972